MEGGRTVAVLVAALFVVPAASVLADEAGDGSPATPLTCEDRPRRPPIVIEHDAMFKLGPAVGVVNPHATGTADDPYVIEGWCLASGPGDRSAAGITINSTSAHVVVRDNVVDGDRQLLENLTEDGGSNDWAWGVDLNGAANVTIADNTIVHHPEANVRVNASSTVQVLGNTLEDSRSGTLLETSTEVTVGQNAITDQSWGVATDRAIGTVIVGNTITKTVQATDIYESQDTTIRDNVVRDDTSGFAVFSSPGTAITNNTVTRSNGYGIVVFSGDDLSITGNTITDSTAPGMDIFRLSNATIANNTVTGGSHGIRLFTVDSGVVADNAVTGNDGDGIELFESSQVPAVGNNIEGNGDAGLVAVGTAQPVEAQGNWWGHASGPSGNVTDACTGTVADGSGEAIRLEDFRGEAEVCFDPWLESPNPEAGAGT